jgi:hypothetical protein
MQAFADLASEGIMPGDSDGVRKFKSMMQGVDVQNVVKEKQDEADAMCEDINTRALKLRNRQLHHATEIYRKRNNLEKVGVPPHDGKCYHCKKPANVNRKTFETNMALCSRLC